MSAAHYTRIIATPHLASLRWDVPAPNQGQIIEVAYAEPGPHVHEAGPGATYKRITDASDRSVAYYRLVQS